jgi:hypothetical protein
MSPDLTSADLIFEAAMAALSVLFDLLEQPAMRLGIQYLISGG